MSEGYEYNLLTQELLLQGYTAEHYPDYVRIGNGRLGKSSLENSCGGFIYTKDYRKVQTATDGKFYEILADSKKIMVKEK